MEDTKVIYTNKFEKALREMPIVDRSKEYLKHITEGEWDKIQCGNEFAVVQIKGNEWRKRICRMGQDGEHVGNYGEEREQHICNGKFIAAAPELVRELIIRIEELESENFDQAIQITSLEDNFELFVPTKFRKNINVTTKI